MHTRHLGAPSPAASSAGSHGTAAGIEAIEKHAWEDFYAAAPPNVASALGLAHFPLDGGLVLISRRIDQITFNRMLGTGTAGAVSHAELDRAIAEFRLAGVKNWVIQIPPYAEAAAHELARRGFTHHPRRWAKFLWSGVPPTPVQTNLVVHEIGPSDADEFAKTVAVAFGLPEAAPWIAQVVGRPGWRSFAAFNGAKLVAGAASFMRDRCAWLGFAGTLPDYRGRGAQGALLAARTNAAIEADVQLITTETGIPHDGEAAPSYRNILRAGFQILYERPNWRAP